MPRDIVAMDGCVEPSRRSIVGAMPCARPGAEAMDGCVEPSRRSIVGAMPCARPGARWVPRWIDTFLFVLFIIPLPLPLAHNVIQRVTFDGFAPGLFNEAYKFRELQAQWREGALSVADTL